MRRTLKLMLMAAGLLALWNPHTRGQVVVDAQHVVGVAFDGLSNQISTNPDNTPDDTSTADVTEGPQIDPHGG